MSEANQVQVSALCVFGTQKSALNCVIILKFLQARHERRITDGIEECVGPSFTSIFDWYIAALLSFVKPSFPTVRSQLCRQKNYSRPNENAP